MKTTFANITLILGLSASPILAAGNDKTAPEFSVNASPPPSSLPPLVIQFAPADTEFVSAMEEDLAIMTRIFEKSLGRLQETPAISKLGIQLMVTRASYMDGFGALFMIMVNFPVIETTSTVENKPAATPGSEWEQAARDLALAGSVNGFIEGAPQYDPTLDSGLKKSLIKSLDNAAHIRGLKPDEFVAITIFGSSVSSPMANFNPGVSRDYEMHTAAGKGGSVWKLAEAKAHGRDFCQNETLCTNCHRDPDVRTLAPAQTLSRGEELTLRQGPRSTPPIAHSAQTSSRGTVLTLRVKRADVDALAKGELTLEQFQSRVSTHTYLGNGYGITSLNSWVRDPAPVSRTVPARGVN